MSYATKQDLIDRFGQAELVQLTDRTNRPASTVDEVVVDRALADAAAIADGYLGKVYALPLAETPPALVKHTADIARYYLHGKAADKDGPVSRAHDQAIAWLRDISRGLIQIDVGGAALPQPAGGTVRVSGSDRIFTADSMKGY
jgi:phage gp36-like protein